MSLACTSENQPNKENESAQVTRLPVVSTMRKFSPRQSENEFYHNSYGEERDVREKLASVARRV